MHIAKKNVDLFLSRKRAKKRKKILAWLERKRVSRARAALYRRSRAGVFGTTSAIAGMLASTASGPLPMSQTSLILNIPKTFSMLEDPGGALRLVASFAHTHQTCAISDVFVDLQKVQVQDLGAHALLDKLVDEIVAQTRFRNTRIGWKGTFPRDPAKQRFISAMGIIRQLRLTHKYLGLNDAEKIHLFERRCRHYVRKLKPIKPEDKTEQANAAERFVIHVNNCLAREDRKLTPLGRSQLCNYVVEIIDNAENHAGMVDWTIQDYVDMAMAQPQCEVVIFNFGKSIAETLDDMPPDSFTWKQQVAEYVDLHTKGGLFSPRWRREDLLTLIALQGSVSCRNLTGETTRGQGTADLIEFFQTMNDERGVEIGDRATMYIVSGGTRILFDSSHRLVRGEDGSRVIAFNENNDLREPPDPACVIPLVGCRLPGTMIGIKFPVRIASLEPVIAAHAAS